MSNVSEALSRAVQQHQAGDFVQAEAGYRKILQGDPGNVDALYLLGLVALHLGRNDSAVDGISQALNLKPGKKSANRKGLRQLPAALQPEAHHHLATGLGRLGKLDEAVASWREAVRLNPGYAEARNSLGIALQQQGKLEEAAAAYQEILRQNPGYAGVHFNLANVLHQQGKLAEAEASYRQALAILPNYVEALNNLGNLLKGQRKLDEAVVCLQQAVRLKPDSAEVHLNLGNVLYEQGKLEEAVASLDKALDLQPDHAEAHYVLGHVRKEQEKLDEAIASYQQALRLKPDYADAHKNLAMVWLLGGDFERGWPEYEWRWKAWKSEGFSVPNFQQPLWDGDSLSGRTILLHAEQGFGDTLQFVRFAQLTKERGGTVLLTCPPRLVPLLTSCPGIDRLIAEGDPLPDFDVHAPLLSLPGILGTTLATIPAKAPYLFADGALVDRWRCELGEQRSFKIGIAWRGSPSYRKDAQRSIPLEQFAPIARLAGVRLFSLQKGAGSEQLSAVADRMTVTDLGRRLDESGGAFMDTAAVMKNLDLVITSDTAVAHLAGALGVPVWVGLSRVPDWRWLLDREDCPWYPTMRLFRQTEPGDWQGVFQRMAAEVQKLLT